MRLVCISDTHGLHRSLVLPDGDVLVHAGDMTHFGKGRQLDDFNEWLGELPFRVKPIGCCRQPRTQRGLETERKAE